MYIQKDNNNNNNKNGNNNIWIITPCIYIYIHDGCSLIYLCRHRYMENMWDNIWKTYDILFMGYCIA